MNTKELIVIALVLYCIAITILSVYLYISKQSIFNSYIEYRTKYTDLTTTNAQTTKVETNYTAVYSGKYIPFNIQLQYAKGTHKSHIFSQTLLDLCCDSNTSIGRLFETFIAQDFKYLAVSLPRVDYYLNKGEQDFIDFVVKYETKHNKSVVDDFQYYKHN